MENLNLQTMKKLRDAVVDWDKHGDKNVLLPPEAQRVVNLARELTTCVNDHPVKAKPYKVPARSSKEPAREVIRF